MKTPHKKSTYRIRPSKLSVAAPACEKESALEYDKDFFKWTKTQANLLKNGRLEELDIDNLKEEIESLGRNDKRSLRSQLTRLFMHLLKIEYQPEKQKDSNSWNNSIADAESEIKYLLEDSPSLRNELKKIHNSSYEDARQRASRETEIDIETFPEECPWEIEEILPFLKKKKN